MKTIGLIGGTGWVSSHEYYKQINEKINQKLGGLQFPRIILYSVNYGDIFACNEKNDRDGVYEIIKKGAQTLEKSGADFIALCANTIHFTYDKLHTEIDLPFVHIADATAEAIRKKDLAKVALLGTRETMEMSFYKDRLKTRGIEVLTPDKAERDYIHNAIMNEMLKEQFLPETKSEFLKIMSGLKAKGAEGMILGCTEIPLLIHEKDFDLPLFSTLDIHTSKIADFTLS